MIEERYCLANAKPMLRENRIEENRIEENRITTIYEFLEKNFGRTIAPIEFEKNRNLVIVIEDIISIEKIETCCHSMKTLLCMLLKYVL